MLSIDDVVADESAGTASFTVTLSGTIMSPVTVDYTTGNGSATAGADYLSASGTLTFNPGDTAKPVVMTVQSDSTSEPTETFLVNLSNASAGVVISDAQAVGSILNDDGAISIGDVSGLEGKANKRQPNYKSFQVTVTLAHASTLNVTKSYQTANGTATTANNDYLAASGTITFVAGDTSETVTVLVVGDNTVEPDETFSVLLANPQNGAISDGTGVGTILNDDTRKGGGPNGGGQILQPVSDPPHADPLGHFTPDRSAAGTASEPLVDHHQRTNKQRPTRDRDDHETETKATVVSQPRRGVRRLDDMVSDAAMVSATAANFSDGAVSGIAGTYDSLAAGQRERDDTLARLVDVVLARDEIAT